MESIVQNAAIAAMKKTEQIFYPEVHPSIVEFAGIRWERIALSERRDYALALRKNPAGVECVLIHSDDYEIISTDILQKEIQTRRDMILGTVTALVAASPLLPAASRTVVNMWHAVTGKPRPKDERRTEW